MDRLRVNGRPTSSRAPRVRIGPPRITGGLDGNAVRAVLRGAEPQVVRCYVRALRRKPSARGTMYVGLVIDRSGHPGSVVAAGVTGPLARCVRRTLSRLSFPPHAGPGSVRVWVPLYFRTSYGPTWRPSSRALPRPPAQRCVATVDNAPLRARRKQLAVCYSAALERDPTLVGRRQVTFDHRGKVEVSSSAGDALDSPLNRCLAAAAEGVRLAVPPTASQVTCTLLLDNPAHRGGGAEGARVEITPSSISVNGRVLLDTAELATNTNASPRRLIAGAVFGRSWSGATRQVTLRAHPAVKIGVLERLLPALRAGASVHYARAIGVTDAWQIVNPGGTADLRACRRASGSVRIEVGKRELRVGYAGAIHAIARRAGRHDFPALVRHLASLRRGVLRGRSDADIGGRPGVQYRAVLRALEVAYAAGFFDARIRSGSVRPRERW